MKYCSECKKIIFDHTEICSCGNKLTESIAAETPIQLTVVSITEKDRISALLDDNKIPYSVQIKEDKSNLTSVPGFETADYKIMVPFAFYKRAIDILVGALTMELPSFYDELPENTESQWSEMSSIKRNAVRLFSAIAFALVVWLIVTGVDVIAAFIKGLF